MKPEILFSSRLEPFSHDDRPNGLSGKISGVVDYFYIGFIVLLNALIYLFTVNVIRAVYQKLCK